MKRSLVRNTPTGTTNLLILTGLGTDSKSGVYHQNSEAADKRVVVLTRPGEVGLIQKQIARTLHIEPIKMTMALGQFPEGFDEFGKLVYPSTAQAGLEKLSGAKALDAFELSDADLAKNARTSLLQVSKH